MEPTVKGRIKNDTVLLSLKYDASLFFDGSTQVKLRDRLRNRYFDLLEEVEGKNCIVKIEADVAGSEIVRALFELWQEVYYRDGVLTCVNYPEEYIDSLLSLGLPSQEGFRLATTVEDALAG